MATTDQLLRRAYEYENDTRRPAKFRYWQHHSIRATKDEVKRLVNDGYACIAIRSGALIKYELTDKGREMACRDVEELLQSVSKTEVIDALELVVGFDDIKEMLGTALAAHRKVNFLLEGPPACAKSVILDGIRSAVPNAFQAFGSRTSAAGLSEVLFEQRPQVLLLDEADKMRHDVYSVLLGLMEKGEILETKSGKTRGIILETIVIAACNSSKKMSPEFLSRFAFHAHFPEYTREEFIDVILGMLSREECPEDLAMLIGRRVYDEKIGDVRKARGIWQLMLEPTEKEVDRVIHMSIKYGPQDMNNKRRRQTGPKFPGME